MNINKMEMKKANECPTKCSHPNVFDYPAISDIPKKTMKKIEAIRGESKKILYCGHCDTLWVEFVLNTREFMTGNVWYYLVRVEDMRTLKEEWVF
jgi:hypothetical protein